MKIPNCISEPLNAEEIATFIQPSNHPFLAELKIFDVIDSTNTYLLTQAKLGAALGTVCLAEQQFQGRGRRGRVWKSPAKAHIYCSVLWRFPVLPADFSGLSLAVAVMVARVLKKRQPSLSVQLKWPNDVLFARRKLAGILLESNVPLSVVVGVGLNVLSSVDMNNAIGLVEIDSTISSRNEIAGQLINELLTGLHLFQEKGVGAFLEEWRHHDMYYGKNIFIHLPDKTLSGVMQGVDENGRLRVKMADGTMQVFSYGEVSMREVEIL